MSRSVVPSTACRLLVKATFAPSGEKVGSVSVDVLWVIWAWFVPSAFIIQISRSIEGSDGLEEGRELSKAILDPSEEKAGDASFPVALVSLAWDDPSAFMV